MLYEQLKGRPDPTPLQERLLLVVHLKRQQQRMTEMEITALLAAPERIEAVKAMVERYRKQLFPGAMQDRLKDAQMEQAKKFLAEETKKVYMVRRLDNIDSLRETVKKAEAAGHGDFTKVAAYEVHKADMAQMRLKSKMEKMKAKRDKGPPKR